MKVLKFGGSSVKTPERIQHVIDIIKGISEQNEIAVVFSAFGGITDKLINTSKTAAEGNSSYLAMLEEIETSHCATIDVLLAGSPGKDAVKKELQTNIGMLRDVLHGVFLLRELSLRTLDLVMSCGERFSNYIIAAVMRAQGLQAEYLNAATVVRTDDDFGQAKVDTAITNRNITAYFEEHKGIQVITGFIAATEKGEITTLGRSGSDYTAAIFAAAIDADEIEIWTDVDGVMTCDPRIVPTAFSIDCMTYEEAMEMSHFGSKVIHPKVMQPALDKNIPIRIKNTFAPEFPGTLIGVKTSSQPYVLRGISSISDIALLMVKGSGMIGIAGISARLFGALARKNISVILISQSSSEHSICFVVIPSLAEQAKRVIEAEFELEILTHQIESVKIERELSIIAIVGEKMRGTPGIAAKIFAAMGRAGTNVVAIAQGSSELNISTVVNKSDETIALNAIHEEFFVKNKKSVHLFVVGVGLVGSKLLEQIQKQARFLDEEFGLQIKIHAIANSKTIITDARGLPLDNWRAQLAAAETPMHYHDFVEVIRKYNYPNAVFVDCTASENITRYYEQIIKLGASIVTPNKKANSSGYASYKHLKQVAVQRGVKFLYETNVGASLPIISTLKDMILSGDRILKIETIISGTISYIFNSFTSGIPFSEVVRDAKKRGFTEPDPREDLNGTDVARKLLILAREIGLDCEVENISVENILPEACRNAENIDQFFRELQKADDHFESIRGRAEAENKVLRYIATLDNGTAAITLQSVDESHPFYHLHGNENIIAITTERYREKPIVIKGPGAGADITAAGVFADIIRIGNG